MENSIHVSYEIFHHFFPGLNHEENMKKMRLLTFMQMAENKKEIDFETIEKKLRLEPSEVEHFIIDGE